MAAVGKRSRRGSAWLGAVLTVHEVLAAGCMRGLRGARPVPYARHPRRRPRMTRAVGSVGQSTAPPGGDGRNGDCLTVHGVIAAVRKRSRGGSAWLGGFLTVHEVLAAGRACGPPASDHRHADPRIESMGRLRRHPRLASAPAVEAGEAGWSPGVIRGAGCQPVLTVHEVLATARGCSPPASHHRHADAGRHPRLASGPAVAAWAVVQRRGPLTVHGVFPRQTHATRR